MGVRRYDWTPAGMSYAPNGGWIEDENYDELADWLRAVESDLKWFIDRRAD